ncbi:MAG: ATP-binding protein [bacterium]
MVDKSLIELPFIGRNRELSLLNEIYNSSLQYQGRVVIIEGAPGIGKTRLVNKFIDDNGLSSITINLSIESGISSRQFLAKTIRLYLHKFNHSIRQINQVIKKEIFEEFVEIVPELNLYLPYTRSAEKEKVFDDYYYFFEFIKNLSYFTPVVFVIEDFHNANNEILKLFDPIFIKKISTLPVLIILTSHSDSEFSKGIYFNHSFGIEKINLTNLSPEEISDLNQLLFDNHLERKFFQWLYDISIGNPLFLIACIHTFFEKGLVYFDERKGRWMTLPNYEEVVIQGGLPGIFQIRLKGLTKKEKDFLETAAIFGEKFDISSSLLKKFKPYLNKFISRGILKKQEQGYGFNHPVIKEIIYNKISKNKKIKVHRKIGEYYKKIGDRFNAVEHLLKANIKNHSLVDTLYNLGIELVERKEFQRATYFLEQALIMAKGLNRINESKILKITELYTRILLKIGFYQKAIKLSQKLIDNLKKVESVDIKQILKIYGVLVHSLVRNGNYYEAIQYTEKSFKFARANKLDTDFDLYEIKIYQAFALKYLGKLDEALKSGLMLYQ